MWPPRDPYALPSKEEIQEIEADILQLEAELVEARRVAALESESGPAALENDIFARKAWIAPIRRLPHETLSLILFELSIDDWKAPLKLQGVCRLWRNILLDTPVAWSFINLDEEDEEPDPDIISKFLERSRNASMHIHVFHESAPSILGQAISLKKKIRCLHIGIWAIDALMSEHNDFSELELLFLSCEESDEVDENKGHQFDMIRLFPKLQTLWLGGDQVVRMIASSPSVPAIRELNATCDDPSSLSPFLKKCAGSVEKIFLFYGSNQPRYVEDEKIAFPVLQFLCLEDWKPSYDANSWVFSGSTPTLQCYVHLAEPSNHDRPSVGASLDPGNIRYLQVVEIPDLSLYPRLHSLVVPFLEDVEEIAKQLRQEPTTCPGLAFIICPSLNEEEEEDVIWEQAKAILREHAEITGRPIKLLGHQVENDPEFEKHFMNSRIYPSVEEDIFTFTWLPTHSCRVC